MTKSRNRIEGEGGRFNTGEIATTSGSSVTWSGIPAWVTKITILFNEVSTNSTDYLIVTIGDAGGLETFGYTQAGGVIVNAGNGAVTANTNGFAIYQGNAAQLWSGRMVIENLDGNTWAESHAGKSSTSRAGAGGGVKTLSDVLTQVSFYGHLGGTFDNGSVALIYE